MKNPLLTLKLSKNSFLDSEVHNDGCSTPLYSISTTGPRSDVMRINLEILGHHLKIADIRWPRRQPTRAKDRDKWAGVILQFNDSRWKSAESLLKPATFWRWEKISYSLPRRTGTIENGHFRPRRFRLPNFPHSLKWKRVGPEYHCVTRPVRGPIAILQLAVGYRPPQLTVFETLEDKNAAGKLLTYRGVSILLLDYLFITSCLIATDAFEWMTLTPPTPKRNLGLSHCRTEKDSVSGFRSHLGEDTKTEASPISTEGTIVSRALTQKSYTRSLADLVTFNESATGSQWDGELMKSSLVRRPSTSTPSLLEEHDSSHVERITSRWDGDGRTSRWEHRSPLAESVLLPPTASYAQSLYSAPSEDELGGPSVHRAYSVSGSASRQWRKLPDPPASTNHISCSGERPSHKPWPSYDHPLPPLPPDAFLDRPVRLTRSNSTASYRRKLPTPPNTSASLRSVQIDPVPVARVSKDVEEVTKWISVLVPQTIPPSQQSLFNPPPAYTPLATPRPSRRRLPDH